MRVIQKAVSGSAALLISAILLLFFSVALNADPMLKIDGESLKFEEQQDVLVIKTSATAQPKISRYGMNNRIVIEFDNAVLMPSLCNLVAGKRGTVVEKFETQVFSRFAVAGPYGGIRNKLTNYDSLLIAYVESGVEADADITGNVITIRFFRLVADAKQNRPLPGNEIKKAVFFRNGFSESLTVTTNASNALKISEEKNPRRLLLSFSSTVLSENLKEQLFREMKDAKLFHVETINVGSAPSPYENTDETGEYHFIAHPTLLKTNDFEERGLGLMNDTLVLAFTPTVDEVDAAVLKRPNGEIEIVFTKRRPRTDLIGSNRVEILTNECLKCKSKDEPGLFPVEDEEGRRIEFYFNDQK